jgi:hypothetical protein
MRGSQRRERAEDSSMMASRIRTTVVGSYPVLPWMVGNPSRLVLRDAIMAVLKTQELAGLDVVTDGELGRFDPSHPEANGMVDYFAARMGGIRNEFRPPSRRSRPGLSPEHGRRSRRQGRRRPAEPARRLRVRA